MIITTRISKYIVPSIIYSQFYFYKGICLAEVFISFIKIQVTFREELMCFNDRFYYYLFKDGGKSTRDSLSSGGNFMCFFDDTFYSLLLDFIYSSSKGICLRETTFK